MFDVPPAQSARRTQHRAAPIRVCFGGSQDTRTHEHGINRIIMTGTDSDYNLKLTIS